MLLISGVPTRNKHALMSVNTTQQEKSDDKILIYLSSLCGSSNEYHQKQIWKIINSHSKIAQMKIVSESILSYCCKFSCKQEHLQPSYLSFSTMQSKWIKNAT